MHDTASEIGRLFFQTYWGKDYKRILDLGAMNYNGSLRDFCPTGAEYVGADLGAGNGVDIVIDDPANLPFDDDSFDVIVSSSCFEHDPLFWMTFLELGRVLKPGGVLYVNAPSNGAVHRFPLDCWRFYPDAGAALVAWGAKNGLDVKLMEAFTAGRIADVWNDCVMIFGKGTVEGRHLAGKLPVPVWNITNGAGGDLQSAEWRTEDMILLRRFQEEMAAADGNCRTMISNMALSRAPADNSGACAVCGHREFDQRTVALDPQLIADWKLSESEAAYIGRRQGSCCLRCGSDLRSQILARAVSSFFASLHPLQALVDMAALTGHILEVGEAGTLSPILRRSPNYVFGASPEIDLMSLPYGDNSFDAVVHSDRLQHVADPIRALAECRRVLKPGGACIFTVPIVADRLSRDRASEQRSIRTEFGSDAWTYASKAGFARVTMDSLDYPTAIAITAWKG